MIQAMFTVVWLEIEALKACLLFFKPINGSDTLQCDVSQNSECKGWIKEITCYTINPFKPSYTIS